MNETKNKVFQKTLSAVIKKRREELGISQAELALQSNLHRSYVFSIEKGDCNVTLECLFSLASALKYQAKDLISNPQKIIETKSIKKEAFPEVGFEAVLLEFARLVKEKRLSQNISQDSLASDTGLHRTFISQLESGKRNISLEKIFLLAESLRCDISDLIPALKIKVKKESPTEEVKINAKEKKLLFKEFAEIIKTKRLKLNLSQEELAFRSGLQRAKVISIEKGEKNTSLEHIYMLAQAFKCRLRELVPQL